MSLETPIPIGVYTIQNLAVPKNVLDVDYLKSADGTRIFSYGSNGGENQKWFVTPLETVFYPGHSGKTGYYVFVSGSAGKFMSAVQTVTNAFPPYATLQLNGVQDLWTISSGTQAGAYYINSVTNAGHVLDLYQANPASETPVVLNTIAAPATTNQQWTFTPVAESA